MREVTDDDDTSDLVVGVQDVMLPTSVPVLPLLDVSAQFCMPAAAQEPVGTWLDVIVVPDGRAALVVGETVGTGLAAAAAMGQVRAILHAGLQRDGDVAGALRLADAYAEHTADARGASVVVAVVDPVRQTMTYATAGHCGPFLVAPDAPRSAHIDPLPGTGGGTLGTGVRADPQPAEVALTAGCVLVLACSTVSSTYADPTSGFGLGSPADVAVHALGSSDVAAVLSARVRTQPHPGLHLELDRNTDAISQSRHALQQWLRELDAPAMDEMALVHATAELVTNAVEHGTASPLAHTSDTPDTPDTSAGSSDPVIVRAELRSDGIVVVEVDDHGTWRQPSFDTSRGRGLAMAAGLVDWLGVTTDDTGTRARLGHRLSRPVRIDTAGPSSIRVLAAPLDIEQRHHDVVALRGDFIDDEADRVAAELLVASRGGTSDVLVDLSQVTRLSSGAVRMLTELTHQRAVIASSGGRLHLRTAHGSSVSRALDVARIVHDAS